VQQGRLKLLWADTSPEYLHRIDLTGERFIFIPGLPGARLIDELDWDTGEVRRWVRCPKSVYRDAVAIGLSKLTFDERLELHRQLEARHAGVISAFDQPDKCKPEEWVTEELKHRFTVERSSLVAILDMGPMALEPGQRRRRQAWLACPRTRLSVTRLNCL
jgi:hypothetical protein